MRAEYRHPTLLFTAAFLLLLPFATPAQGQGTRADYERAFQLYERLDGLVTDMPGAPVWIEGSARFWYRKTVEGGAVFVLVDPESREQGAAFDHARIAASLSARTNSRYTAITLPFQTFRYADGGRAIEFTAADSSWRCTLAGTGDPAAACSTTPGRAAAGGFGGQARPGGFQGGSGSATASQPRRSPDGRYEAAIRNYNLHLRAVGTEEWRPLSYDGSEGNAYDARSIAWSPDSKRIAAYRVQPGYVRTVYYVESSPEDQLQPKLMTRTYTKPGDVLPVQRPVLFDVETGRQVLVDNSLFPNAYSMSRLAWRKDGRAFTFEYNQRGHQVYRVIEVDAATGAARALVSEEVGTFFYYRPATGNLTENGRYFRHDVDDGREIVWMSERDGWNHLYLYDGKTGKVKNQITKGEWVVSAVDHVDEKRRLVWFRAVGMNPGEDPYFAHAYRIGFDGKGLTRLTEPEGNHTISYSPDMRFLVDTWSTVQEPPVSVLRDAETGRVLMELERADASRLLATGWRPPEVFTAKGRDGKTDIWGIIIRPIDFDPARKYPVIELIYAGPHGSFVPKSFGTHTALLAKAELGFIVVQIDGMGTNNRSKAFHDVAWKNLKDAGFPDRILWHQAAARKYPHYDIERVGIYGRSAGGQNSMGALLFHPELYKVAVSTVGSHDNRMDKIWWNELWMGWPIGPHYAASSNVDNAHRLQGKLQLVVGELDTNVDPATTMQVVNALIKADKEFDLLFLPGEGHRAGGRYAERKRMDFFVRHLLGVEPPDWNAQPLTTRVAS